MIVNIGKLKTPPVDLSKPSDVVKYNFVKKTVYDKLVKEVNTIQTTDTSNLVENADYNKKKF